MLQSLVALKRSVLLSSALRAAPHNRGLKLLLVIVSLISGSGKQAIAQDNPVNPEDVVRVRTNLVAVPAVVTDSRGRRVFGLKREEFSLSDNGRSAPLDYLSTGTDRVALLFLLDASGSAREYLSKQREAALSLFSKFGTGSRIAVLRFSDRAQVTIPFTANIGNARSGFEFPVVAGRQTAIFDSALTALRLFEARESDPTERRIVILTSDGLDTASATRPTEVIDRARADGISFYVIHFPIFTPAEGHLTARSPAKGFRELAQRTGGRFFTAGNAKSALNPRAEYNLAQVFRSIEEDLASQYVLGFYPDQISRGSSQHRLEVGLVGAANRKLRVRMLRENYSLSNK